MRVKNYLANKTFSRGIETLSAEASMAFIGNTKHSVELLSNLVFEGCWSCGDLVGFGFNSVSEFDACDDFGAGVKAA